MILEEQTWIDTDPADVFRFFETMEDQYEDWHPDHILFRWREGGELQEDAEAYFEERIGGQLQQKTVVFTRIRPNRYLEFRPTDWTRLLLPSISFSIEPDDCGCTVVQRIKVRTGPIGRFLNRREFEAVRTHMREEGENLKRLLEDDLGD